MNRDRVEVFDNVEAEQFEVRVDGELAFLSYTKAEGKLFLLHTDVPPAVEGRGLGGALARAALEHARTHGMGVVPFCPFVQAYLRRHSEYQMLVPHGDA